MGNIVDFTAVIQIAPPAASALPPPLNPDQVIADITHCLMHEGSHTLDPRALDRMDRFFGYPAQSPPKQHYERKGRILALDWLEDHFRSSDQSDMTQHRANIVRHLYEHYIVPGNNHDNHLGIFMNVLYLSYGFAPDTVKNDILGRLITYPKTPDGRQIWSIPPPHELIENLKYITSIARQRSRPGPTPIGQIQANSLSF